MLSRRIHKETLVTPNKHNWRIALLMSSRVEVGVIIIINFDPSLACHLRLSFVLVLTKRSNYYFLQLSHISEV